MTGKGSLARSASTTRTRPSRDSHLMISEVHGPPPSCCGRRLAQFNSLSGTPNWNDQAHLGLQADSVGGKRPDWHSADRLFKTDRQVGWKNHSNKSYDFLSTYRTLMLLLVYLAQSHQMTRRSNPPPQWQQNWCDPDFPSTDSSRISTYGQECVKAEPLASVCLTPPGESFQRRNVANSSHRCIDDDKKG